MQDAKNEKTLNPKVTIAIRNDRVQCTPERVHARKGQAIEWKSVGDIPFAIHLGAASPFPAKHHQSRGNNGVNFLVPTDGNVRPNVEYKYVVAIYANGNVWIEDPIIIIDP